MLVSLGSGLITLAAPGFSVGQTRRQPSPIALNIFRESRTAEWFRARDWASLASLQSTVPLWSVRSSWDGLGLVRRLVFFYDNLGVFVAYKVIGRDLAIGFRGVGMNEARPIS